MGSLQEADETVSRMDETNEQPTRELSAAARRALDEATARRKAAEAQVLRPAEKGGRGGLDPVRYGDWEIKGIACDF